MRKETLSLKSKYDIIKKNFNDLAYITVSDISGLFPTLEKSSVYWMISKMVKEGYLKRIRNGVYSINEIKGKSTVFLSNLAKKIENLLESEGYNFYFSGIDIIIRFMQHVPEEYTSMIFVEKNVENDIIQLLKENDISVIKSNAIKNIDDDYVYTIMKPNVVLYTTNNFDFSENNFAIPEKAFIDLFYAITRNEYPMSLQELGRTLNNMIRLGVIDQKKMITISYKRNLQYDIRYIVENKYLSEGAKELIKYL